jgi:hypothetical protein
MCTVVDLPAPLGPRKPNAVDGADAALELTHQPVRLDAVLVAHPLSLRTAPHPTGRAALGEIRTSAVPGEIVY